VRIYSIILYNSVYYCMCIYIPSAPGPGALGCACRRQPPHLNYTVRAAGDARGLPQIASAAKSAAPRSRARRRGSRRDTRAPLSGAAPLPPLTPPPPPRARSSQCLPRETKASQRCPPSLSQQRVQRALRMHRSRGCRPPRQTRLRRPPDRRSGRHGRRMHVCVGLRMGPRGRPVQLRRIRGTDR
jgi:hypothetical protein